MFDFLFEVVCGKEYNIMAITNYNGKLCAVPCDDAIGGIYPRYSKMVKLSEYKCELFNWNDFNFWEVKDKSVRNSAIIIERCIHNDGYIFNIDIAEDSWDGFQIC